MNNKIIFLIIILASTFLGLFVGIINNDITQEKQSNLKKNDINKSHEKNDESDIKTKDNESDKNKNPIIQISDFIKEEDEEEKNKKDKKENDENKADDKNKDKDKESDKKEQKKIIDGIDNFVHIAFSLDNKFIYPLLVCLTSLLENRAPTTFYVIHIQTSKNIKKENIGKINKLIERYGKKASNISYYDMGDDFKGAITGTHITVASYYRIALPSLLPKVDKIIYSDADVVCFKDLSEMYNLKFNDNVYLMSILDNIGLLNELKQLGVYTLKYMNAGILLMNLKGIRKDGIEQKIRKYIFSHYLDHHDQTALNAVCYNNYQILSCKYATFVFSSFEQIKDWNNKQNKLFRYNDYEINQAFYDPCLLHYVGWTKPWDKGYKKLYGEYWWYYAKISGFYEEILKNYNFDEKTIEKLLEKIPKDGGLVKHSYKK